MRFVGLAWRLGVPDGDRHLAEARVPVFVDDRGVPAAELLTVEVTQIVPKHEVAVGDRGVLRDLGEIVTPMGRDQEPVLTCPLLGEVSPGTEQPVRHAATENGCATALPQIGNESPDER